MWARLVSTLAIILAAGAVCAGEGRTVKVLIISGDHGHDWRKTTPFLKELLTKAGHKVDVTEAPSKDLTPDNLAKYQVLLLNYRNTPQGAKDNPQSVWSEENKKAFREAVKGGKGLVVYHHASSAFTGDNEFDREGTKLTFTREAAHSRSRILHAHGDSTGREIGRALAAKARTLSNIQFSEFEFSANLWKPHERVEGVVLIRDGHGQRLLQRRPHHSGVTEHDDDVLQLGHRVVLRRHIKRLHVNQRGLNRDDDGVAAQHLRALLIQKRQLP